MHCGWKSFKKRIDFLGMPGIREDVIRFVVLKFRVHRSFSCHLFSVIYVLMPAVNSGKMYMRHIFYYGGDQSALHL